MQDNEMCGIPYTRPLKLFPSDGIVPRIPCTFIKDHGANCSWFALKAADDIELERLREQEREQEQAVLPAEVQKVLDDIQVGDFDAYLEILLSVAHGRKLALRSVRGFPRRVS